MKMFQIKKTLPVICFIVSIISVIVYRYFLLKDYAAQWVDEDQALLWYGTSLAAHFGLKEPHFLGQAYGSMLESIVAVPLYWLGVPHNFALPIATSVLWFSPFLICAIKLWKKNTSIATVLILYSMLFRWDYDILAGMPRSFISGFIFSFIGLVLLIESDKTAKWKAFIAPILLALAFINTETTITIIGLGVLFYLLFLFKNLYSTWYVVVSGTFCGILLILFCNRIFYILNPEYLLHGGANSISFSKHVLLQNLSSIKSLLCSFSLVNLSNIPIVLIISMMILLILCIIYKQWKLLLLYICALGGSVLFLAHPKSMDFYDSLFFSQTRMFLFVPYIMLLLFYVTSVAICTKHNITGPSIKVNILIACLCVVLSAVKIVYFEKVVVQKEELYTSAIVRVTNISEVYSAANEIGKYAEENNCEIVVLLTDNRTIGYCTGAINYSKYISYNAFYDRRSATYLHFKNCLIDNNVLFVYYKDGSVSKMMCEHVTGNLIDYIRENKGIQRYPAGSEYYIEQ